MAFEKLDSDMIEYNIATAGINAESMKVSKESLEKPMMGDKYCVVAKMATIINRTRTISMNVCLLCIY
ncbi:hypothetical protein [Haladaptatus sp. W1]|uniref:hypothetical protein n=1 Tax=Haladaptatus sp. W1 TaxID=1897478 RepID=UPI001113005D|nr:hypothetical protein [Haladaptatus sp. W1]